MPPQISYLQFPSPTSSPPPLRLPSQTVIMTPMVHLLLLPLLLSIVSTQRCQLLLQSFNTDMNLLAGLRNSWCGVLFGYVHIQFMAQV